MKQKYYGLKDKELLCIGEYSSYEDIPLVYRLNHNAIYTVDEWKEIIPKMLESIKHEYE